MVWKVYSAVVARLFKDSRRLLSVGAFILSVITGGYAFILTVWNIKKSIRLGRHSQLHEYSDNFYRFLASFAVRSAEQIVPVCPVADQQRVDFGCGQAAWLSVWRKAG